MEGQFSGTHLKKRKISVKKNRYNKSDNSLAHMRIIFGSSLCIYAGGKYKYFKRSFLCNSARTNPLKMIY
jgi:hypothetical protein